MSLPKFSLYVKIWGLHLHCPSGTESGTCVPAHPLCAQERGNSLPQPALCPPWLKGLPNHLGFSIPSTVKKENMLLSPYFGHCFSTSVSLSGQLPHSCQHPPLQHQTLAATSPRGSSAKPTNCLFVQGHLVTKGLRAQPRKAPRCRHQHRANSAIPCTRAASKLSTVSSGSETRADLPEQSTAWAQAEGWEEAPSLTPRAVTPWHTGTQSPVPTPCCQPAAQPPSPETCTLWQIPSQESFLGRGARA